MNMFQVFPMTHDDISEVAHIERESFTDAWSEGALEDFCHGNTWRGFVVREGDCLAGYLLVQQVMDEGEILRIAILDKFKRRGVASVLLESVFAEASEIMFWNLEVRESNRPARACYEKFGFAVIGTRKSYYHNPTEDAVLMQKVIER